MEKDVKEIKWRVEGVEKSMDLLVRANRKEIVADLLEFFGKSKDRVQVFLEIDGEKTVGEISQKLNMKDANVSKRTTELVDEGLIRVKKITKVGKVYEKAEKVKTLDLEKILRRKFHLDEKKAAQSPVVISGESSEE